MPAQIPITRLIFCTLVSTYRPHWIKENKDVGRIRNRFKTAPIASGSDQSAPMKATVSTRGAPDTALVPQRAAGPPGRVSAGNILVEGSPSGRTRSAARPPMRIRRASSRQCVELSKCVHIRGAQRPRATASANPPRSVASTPQVLAELLDALARPCSRGVSWRFHPRGLAQPTA